jgi:hypothetical protein
MPLGLVSSEVVDDFWSQNTRRKIAYSYPNGTAPLTALLSLADTEETSIPQFGWNEQRWEQLRTLTIAGPSSNVTFYLGGTTTTAGATFTPTAGTAYRIYVADASMWQADDVLKIHRIPYGSTTVEASFRVTSANTTGLDYVEAVAIATAPGAVTNNAATIVGIPVVYSGSAFAEGSRSRNGRYRFPSEMLNNTQIHKTAFEMTRTALKEPLKYDKTGDYRNQLKGNGIDHLAGIEWSSLFGDKSYTTAEDPDTGSTVSRRTSGGLLWFLKQWEKGSMSNGGAFDYRSNATDVSAQTDYITYADKRIIRLGGGTVTLDTFNEIEALPFAKTNSTEFCKLCLAGPGYIAKVNARLQKDIQKTALKGDEYTGWDFKLASRSGLNGDIYYKSHPLFANTEMKNSAFYIDLGFIKWRPLVDSDTDIQQMIQLPDADKRKDQWLTEGGVEFMFPEAHMFVDGLGGISL